MTVFVQKRLKSWPDVCLSVDLRPAELDSCTQLFNDCRLSEDISWRRLLIVRCLAGCWLQLHQMNTRRRPSSIIHHDERFEQLFDTYVLFILSFHSFILKQNIFIILYYMNLFYNKIFLIITITTHNYLFYL